jgi:phage antirepressor YoqD-like protein
MVARRVSKSYQKLAIRKKPKQSSAAPKITTETTSQNPPGSTEQPQDQSKTPDQGQAQAPPEIVPPEPNQDDPNTPVNPFEALDKDLTAVRVFQIEAANPGRLLTDDQIAGMLGVCRMTVNNKRNLPAYRAARVEAAKSALELAKEAQAKIFRKLLRLSEEDDTPKTQLAACRILFNITLAEHKLDIIRETAKNLKVPQEQLIRFLTDDTLTVIGEAAHQDEAKPAEKTVECQVAPAAIPAGAPAGADNAAEPAPPGSREIKAKPVKPEHRGPDPEAAQDTGGSDVFWDGDTNDDGSVGLL